MSRLDSVPAALVASYLSVNLISFFKIPRFLGILLERIMALYRQGSIPTPPLAVRNFTELNESIVSFTDSLCDSKIAITHKTGNSTVDVVQSHPR